MMNIIIKGSGSYTPENVMRNADFKDHVFLSEDGLAIKFPESIIGKFKDITGIEERRYADSQHVTSDLASSQLKKLLKMQILIVNPLIILLSHIITGILKKEKFSLILFPVLRLV